MITICVPVLKRYDLLCGLLASLETSDVCPDKVQVIDNGRNHVQIGKVMDRVARTAAGVAARTEVHVPDHPMGVAESWNWFIEHVPQERVIVNDDIIFAPHSLGKLLSSPADLVWAKGCGFSCYVLRDSGVQKIGPFDEAISPGYGYYEDEDYLQRLDGRGTKPRKAEAEEVDCGVTHLHSQTLQAASHEDLMEHHRKFKIAQGNYMKKWGLTTI